MKRICHITSDHSIFDPRIFLKECRSLSQYYDVTILANGFPDSVNDGDKQDGVRLLKGRPLKRFIAKVFFPSFFLIKKALSCRADLYHFHDPTLLPLGLMLKLCRKRVIYDVHEDVPKQLLAKYFIPPVLRPIIAGAMRLFETFCAKRFDGIVCVHDALVSRFKHAGCRRVVEVCNYPMLQEFSGPSLPWSAKKRQVAYAGGITHVRGIYETCQAATDCDCDIQIAGPFLKRGLEAEIREKFMSKNVHLLGNLKRDKVKQLLDESIAGLVIFLPIPNHMDCQPNKIFEYMAMGIPIIGSNFDQFKTLIEGHNIGFCVDPTDTDAIAQAINTLCNDLTLAEEMGRRGRALVLSHFHWEITFKSLLSLYRDILGE